MAHQGATQVPLVSHVVGAYDGIQLWHTLTEYFTRERASEIHPHLKAGEVNKSLSTEVDSPASRKLECFSETWQNSGFSNNV